jgi:hypothetical protein
VTPSVPSVAPRQLRRSALAARCAAALRTRGS